MLGVIGVKSFTFPGERFLHLLEGCVVHVLNDLIDLTNAIAFPEKTVRDPRDKTFRKTLFRPSGQDTRGGRIRRNVQGIREHTVIRISQVVRHCELRRQAIRQRNPADPIPLSARLRKGKHKAVVGRFNKLSQMPVNIITFHARPVTGTPGCIDRRADIILDPYIGLLISRKRLIINRYQAILFKTGGGRRTPRPLTPLYKFPSSRSGRLPRGG
ncbi:MAG: hypothetical protein BWY49_00808 [Candidatus Omnitrophica bacterium ADurb.Bin314]|nr:MAG: hypothetical protein BWY49_00808 [Candidatus Omnitrophica bacterium ADurb.Bin314]